MTIPSIPSPPLYQSIPPTTASLSYATLITLDLSLFPTPTGKQLLAAQLKKAISTIGFFYVTNFGLDSRKVDAQFSIAQALFAQPDEEKAPYRVNADRQGYFGWKPAGSRAAQFGLKDNLELFDDAKYSAAHADFSRPAALQERRQESEEFGRHMHFFVVYRLLYLCGMIMELPDPEALWKKHDYEKRSQCHLRYMLYHPRTEEELEVMKEKGLQENVYGHTDFGSLTLLMRQPVAGLQVRVTNESGEQSWKWVKPMENSLTVNVADTLSFLTGGYLKSTVHRVVLPPEDQRHLPRYGVIYFAGPDDETLLKPVHSPLLEKGDEEVQKRDLPPDTTTAGEWVSARFKSIDRNYQTNKDNAVEVGMRSVQAYA
ncbi:2OG-Fe(II) oxygenase superfamily protein [Melanomma pulvis-pyrius CBS 109.77]|uniref:2OG-Fe(II) oxygenase superfamily protein n=1 Tax=Melanomma pulvis-pyrius CBS 109.77 TaxID=1314802 RepID=A0A6A6XCM1_9PLEO|nr:2OG-Fe(II) oxygenase superfamily protein [Melanomma pulvis-pyrius CBS 109.77]